MNEKTIAESECCAQKQYTVRRSDLPLSCPTSKMSHWDGHPKVFLDIERTGQVSCPYCGTVYLLVD